MGNPDTFYRPDRWNPEGYYEQSDIHAINMPLINGPWWKFAYFRLPSTKTILKRAKRMEAQIRQTTKDYDACVIKETRFCLTLPAWLKYDASVESILICLRDPTQAALSIQKRNSTTLKHGYNLWYEHNHRIMNHADDIPIWFVDYHNLLNSATYQQEADAAFRFFGFEFSADQLAGLRAKAVREDMNHNQEAAERIGEYPEKVGTLWEALRQKHAAQFS